MVISIHSFAAAHPLFKEEKKRIAVIDGGDLFAGEENEFESKHGINVKMCQVLSRMFVLYLYTPHAGFGNKKNSMFGTKARYYHLPFSANSIAKLLQQWIAVLHALTVSDILIVSGIRCGILFPFIRMFTRKKIVVHLGYPDWKLQDKKAAIRFLKWFEKMSLKWSHADVAECELIKRYISFHYKTKSYIIEQPGNHAKGILPSADDYKTFPFLKGPYAFCIGEIVPGNHMHKIIMSFRCSQLTLVVAGNFSETRYAEKIKESCRESSNIIFIDSPGNRDLNLLRSNSFVYVHAHVLPAENHRLAEAMSIPLPVIAFDCQNNRSVTENSAVYFRDEYDLMDKILELPGYDLIGMKKKMKNIASKKYTWKKMRKSYSDVITAFEFDYKKPPLHNKLSGLDSEFLLKKKMAHLGYEEFHAISPDE